MNTRYRLEVKNKEKRFGQIAPSLGKGFSVFRHFRGHIMGYRISPNTTNFIQTTFEKYPKFLAEILDGRGVVGANFFGAIATKAVSSLLSPESAGEWQ